MATTNPIRVVYLASATGAQEALSIDWRDQVPSGYSFEVQFNGAAAGSVTIQSTLDDINDSTITPDWITETVAITADTRGIIAHPVTAVRVNIGSLAGGTLTFKLLGGSLIGDVTGLVIPGGGGGPSSNVNLAQVGGTTVVTAGVAGLLAVGGSVASGVADAGNPVKVGGVVGPTGGFGPYSTGQRSDLWLSVNGAAVISGITQTGADALANGNLMSLAAVNSTGVRAFIIASHLFNGTAWDRQRMNPAASGGAALVELGPYAFGRVTADGQIKGSAGFIHTITISPNGTVTAGVLTIYNSLTETGTIVAQFALPVTTFTPFSVTLDVACGTGIFVGFDATLANVSCTVSYR